MAVRDKHRVDFRDALAQRLLPEIGRYINENVFVIMFNKNRRSRPVVFWIGQGQPAYVFFTTLKIVEHAVDRRHAMGRAGAQKGDFNVGHYIYAKIRFAITFFIV